MKILSIGNSFSQDAQRYLSRLAKHNGEDLLTVNLMIGGCSLEKHYDCMINDKREYMLEVNGVTTGIWVTMSQVLTSCKWDYVTIQQASHLSFDYSTYLPYAKNLVDYVKEVNPDAKILFHETWAYEDGSYRLKDVAKLDSASTMYDLINENVNKITREINLDGIIPSGTAFRRAIELGIGKMHRDTFHASLGAGRYLLALCWYKKIYGVDVGLDTYNDFDEPVSDKEKRIVIEAVNFAFNER